MKTLSGKLTKQFVFYLTTPTPLFLSKEGIFVQILNTRNLSPNFRVGELWQMILRIDIWLELRTS